MGGGGGDTKCIKQAVGKGAGEGGGGGGEFRERRERLSGLERGMEFWTIKI